MEQTWIINEVLLTGRSYSHMEERYNLPRATLCKWVKQFSETGRVMGKRGRPLRVDKDLIDALELSTTDQASAENLKKKIQEAAKTTAARRNIAPVLNKQVSNRTVKRYIVGLKAKMKNSEVRNPHHPRSFEA
jgi:transposase-like protein